jgi:hypothetical protein
MVCKSLRISEHPFSQKRSSRLKSLLTLRSPFPLMRFSFRHRSSGQSLEDYGVLASRQSW